MKYLGDDLLTEFLYLDLFDEQIKMKVSLEEANKNPSKFISEIAKLNEAKDYIISVYKYYDWAERMYNSGRLDFEFLSEKFNISNYNIKTIDVDELSSVSVYYKEKVNYFLNIRASVLLEYGESHSTRVYDLILYCLQEKLKLIEVESSKIDKKKRRSKFSRVQPIAYAALSKLYGEKCAKCGEVKDLTVDHIVPIAKGGKDEFDNFQLLCRKCNSSKGIN